jgi:hypothetical protein
MRQFRTYGSLRGAAGYRWPYRVPLLFLLRQQAAVQAGGFRFPDGYNMPLQSIPALCGRLAMVVSTWLPASLAQAEPNIIAGENDARAYTTQEERRQAGIPYTLAPNLTVAPIAEFELGHETREPSAGKRGGDGALSVQLAFEFAPLDSAKAEIIYELNVTGTETRHLIEEAMVSFELGAAELELGRTNVPFGIYYSRFASGPLLEFGETRAPSAVLSVEPGGATRAAGYVYRGRARRADNGGKWDWGLAAETEPLPDLRIGLAYQSDLADAKERPLRDHDDRHARRVGGFNAHAQATLGQFSFTAEWLMATDAFQELDADRNRPSAWNFEAAMRTSADTAVALRVEGSRELDDAPHRRLGLAFSWRPTEQATLTVEYLRGTYKPGFAQDATGRDIRRVNQIGALLSLLF